MKILGDKINLRTINESDADSIYRNAKDRKISQYTLVPFPYTLKHAKGFIKIAKSDIRKKKAIHFGIEDHKSRKIIGMISLLNLDFDNKNAEIGFWLGKEHWRKGYATDAIILIINYGFNKLKLYRIYAKVMEPNIASLKLLQKVGFKTEGKLRSANYRNKKWIDDICLSILKID